MPINQCENHDGQGCLKRFLAIRPDDFAYFTSRALYEAPQLLALRRLKRN